MGFDFANATPYDTFYYVYGNYFATIPFEELTTIYEFYKKTKIINCKEPNNEFHTFLSTCSGSDLSRYINHIHEVFHEFYENCKAKQKEDEPVLVEYPNKRNLINEVEFALQTKIIDSTTPMLDMIRFKNLTKQYEDTNTDIKIIINHLYENNKMYMGPALSNKFVNYIKRTKYQPTFDNPAETVIHKSYKHPTVNEPAEASQYLTVDNPAKTNAIDTIPIWIIKVKQNPTFYSGVINNIYCGNAKEGSVLNFRKGNIFQPQFYIFYYSENPLQYGLPAKIEILINNKCISTFDVNTSQANIMNPYVGTLFINTSQYIPIMKNLLIFKAYNSDDQPFPEPLTIYYSYANIIYDETKYYEFDINEQNYLFHNNEILE